MRDTFKHPPPGLGGARSREAWMRMPLGTRALVAVAVLLIAGLLAGCDDEDPPDSKESTSAPAPPTTSATTETTPTGQVEPALPTEAETATKSGVEAFVTYYFDTINYAILTGDVDLLKTLDQPSCSGCQGGIDFIARVYSHGGKVVGGQYRVLKMTSVPSPSGAWTVEVHTHLGNQRVVGAGKLNHQYSGGKAKWFVGVARVRGDWSIATLDIL